MTTGNLHPMHLAAGPLLWCLWFVVAYGGLSVGCALAPPDPAQGARNALNLVLGLAGVVFVLTLAAGVRHCLRLADRGAAGRNRFIGRTAAGLYALSALAALWVGLPLLFLPPCV